MYPENSEEKNLVETPHPDGESNLDPSEGACGQAMELSYNGRISEVEELFSGSFL
jgi:hypothetical protein